MSANNISQQSKETKVRGGYPLSSASMNDALDALLYDLIEILVTDKLQLSDIMDQLLSGLSTVEAASFRLRKEYIEDIINDHTTNWRHV